MRRLVALALPVAAMLTATATPAHAAAAFTGPGGFLTGFVPPVIVISPGEELTYTNADIAQHNLRASESFLPKRKAKKAAWCSAYEKGKCPLFWSETIGTGATTDVLGLELLRSGDQHAFFCSLHPNMSGVLIVR